MTFMMRSNTPGVYLREVEPLSPVPLRLSVTGFAGQSERGPLNHPQPLTGWSQFQDIFGGFVGFSYLPYAVFGFFLNGGERCYVVRVGHETARRACLDLVSEKNEPVIRVEAINEGEWAGEVSVVCDEKSTSDMTLTELDGDASKSTVIDKDTAKLKSVAGLDALDEVSIVNRLDPFLREEGLEIIGIDFNAKTVKFDREIARPFPAGSSVLGKGFRLGFEYRVNGRTLREEVFDNLSMEESHERYFASVINGDPEEKDYSKKLENGNSILVRVADLVKGRPGSISRPKTITAQGLKGGQDGPRNLDARYYTGYDQEAYFRPRPPDADETELKEIEEKLFGLAAFEAVGEIGLIAIPDLILPDMYAQVPESKIPKAGIIFAGTGLDMLRLENLKAGQRDMLRHCEKLGDRFAILDSPRGAETRKGAGRIEDWPKDLRPFPNSKNGALYYPWIKEKIS
ncbi:MAG: hypothetical protein L0229_15495, partial [Blastocatellia bacterium]|nr:hypothetical protein [Blastocatellia bacterium]